MVIENHLKAVSGVLLKVDIGAVYEAYRMISRTIQSGRRVYIIGNGGSASTASHLACDLQKGIGGKSDKPCRVIALTDNTPLITAWANDQSYADVYYEQIKALVESGDLVIGISASGNSPNIIKAIDRANRRGASTVALTGYDGGMLKNFALLNVVVNETDMQVIEDVHSVICHSIFKMLEV